MHVFRYIFEQNCDLLVDDFVVGVERHRSTSIIQKF